ncbi:iron-containing alcohol dehydrogenase, partial [gut metagenome]
MGSKTKMVCIPTTSGTGSEVTSFSVITDKLNGNIKYPLADYSLTPNVAIIDPQFTRSMPRSIVADTGLDVLTHAIEAYVSVMASDYTDGLALQAIEMVFHYLERSYNGDPIAREKMHNASCIAGMAFTNAFLGLNHSMAHKLGGDFHIPHGRANAILLPYVTRYNATRPTKFASFPKYKEYIADERYAKIAWRCGLCSKDTPINEAVDCLINAIIDLMKKTERPMTIKDCGVSEADFLAKVDELSYK